MQFPTRFLCAGPAYSTLEEFVPAPYFRKTFEIDDPAAPCGILVTEMIVSEREVSVLRER